MAFSLNEVKLIGYLGQDPETRYTQSGTAVCNMRIATNERYKDSNGEWVDRTEWHSIVAWARLADACDNSLSKGSRVFVHGKLQTREWEDKEGNKRWTTEVVAREVGFLDPKQDGGGQSQRTSSNRGQKQTEDQSQKERYSGGDDQGFEPDDDLPF